MNFGSKHRRWFHGLIAAGCVLNAGCAHSPQVSAPVFQQPAPDIAPTLNAAKTVFVLNGGEETYYAAQIPGDQNVTYNEFYTALKATGRFELVNDPRRADLVFSISGTEDEPDSSKVHVPRGIDDYITTFAPPFIHLVILRPADSKMLYQITWTPGRGKNVAQGIPAFAQSINALVAKTLTSVFSVENVALADPASLVGAVGPVPAPLVEGKSIYLRAGGGVTAQDLDALTVAMKAWGRYTVVTNPTGADLMLEEEADGTATIWTGGAQPSELWVLSRAKSGETRSVRGAKGRASIAAALVKRLQTLVSAQPVGA
jgi:hypothetical protein